MERLEHAHFRGQGHLDHAVQVADRAIAGLDVDAAAIAAALAARVDTRRDAFVATSDGSTSRSWVDAGRALIDVVDEDRPGGREWTVGELGGFTMLAWVRPEVGVTRWCWSSTGCRAAASWSTGPGSATSTRGSDHAVGEQALGSSTGSSYNSSTNGLGTSGSVIVLCSRAGQAVRARPRARRRVCSRRSAGQGDGRTGAPRLGAGRPAVAPRVADERSPSVAAGMVLAEFNDQLDAALRGRSHGGSAAASTPPRCTRPIVDAVIKVPTATFRMDLDTTIDAGPT